MRLESSYWFIHNAVSIENCDRILKLAKVKKKQRGLIGASVKDLKLRNSRITWLNDQWIYDLLFPLVKSLNTASGWNFEFDYAEACQFGCYAQNQHYDWHQDTRPVNREPNNKSLDGKIRKLSSGLMLSNPEDFKGGEFQFYYNNKSPDEYEKNTEIVKLSKGTLICFPSHIYHRVKPVTEGTRYSLTTWYLGQPFK